MSLFDVCRDGFFRKDVATRREPSGDQGRSNGSLEFRSNGTTNNPSYHHGTHGTLHFQHL